MNNRYFTISAVLFCLFAIGCTKKNQESGQLSQRADAEFCSGRFDSAEELYQKALLRESRNPAILERLGQLELLHNRPDEALRFFSQALSVTPWYASFWPLSADLKYRIGSALYRKDSFAEASRFFAEAAGPLPYGPFRELQSLSLHAAQFRGLTPCLIDGPEESRIPFVITDPLPVVQVSVNGSEPLNFFIDTGGAELMLDKAAAKRLGAKIAASFAGSYAGKKSAETGAGMVDYVRIGAMTMRNVPVYTLDLTEPMQPVFGKHRISGIIGTRTLMHYCSTIDYRNGTLVLAKKGGVRTRMLNGMVGAGKAKAVPFRLAETHVMLAEGMVNDHGPVLFFIDTGLAGKGFTASDKLLKAAGIPVEWSKAAEGVGGGGNPKSTDILVKRLSIGSGDNKSVRMEVPGVAIENSVAILDGSLGFDVGGMISHSFFRDQAVTLDFESMLLILQ
ncbi:MAG: tetratricopeptide repeat protein [Chlorobiaceae bacterium]|nr:tetratricopeptide repeat protein [Chlorobiaceae bacterium]